MRPWQGIGLALLFAWNSGLHAAAPNDYAARWHLRLEGTPPLFAVEPGEEALRLLQDPAFGDLQVFDAQGRPLPMRQVPGSNTPAGWWPLRMASSSPAEGAAGDAGVMDYTYRLPAPLAVEAVRLRFAPTARVERVLVLYREDTADWTVAARVETTGNRDEPVTVRLDAPVTAREWRVRSGRALVPAPGLTLAWRAPRFIVRADGPPPYLLAAGHPVARHAALPPAVAAASAPLAAFGPRLLAPFEPAPPPAAPPPPRIWPWLLGSVLLATLVAVVLVRRRRHR
ncbi:DUF3999 family protein [Vulcaniibacterium gelatinicum]|uniref:DUF3999 family protein n=1 Tax=Vulcaniibacterium gelatinicum TaxID=2598725 RepID=UPI0011C6F6DA|nr:DUF3999 family protein [Vulcaniibacterium gelatinicum]